MVLHDTGGRLVPLTTIMSRSPERSVSHLTARNNFVYILTIELRRRFGKSVEFLCVSSLSSSVEPHYSEVLSAALCFVSLLKRPGMFLLVVPPLHSVCQLRRE